MASGESWYRHRGWLVLPPLLLALFIHDFELEKHALVWGSGLTLFVAGVALRLWAQQHVHYRLAAETVCTRSGPYALTRNPIYIGNTLS